MGIEIDGNMIKKMSNGGLDDIIGREHCGNESEFKVGFLPILFAQDMDRITPKDDAVVTRMRAVHYEKTFVDSPSNDFELLKDPNMESEIQTEKFRYAFLWILMMQEYKVFQDNNRVETEPEGVVQARAEILGDDENIINSFTSMFGHITNDPKDYIESKEIQKWLKDGDYKVSATKFGLEMKKYLKTNKRDFDQVCNKPKKIQTKSVQVWFGLRKFHDPNIDEDKVIGCVLNMKK